VARVLELARVLPEEWRTPAGSRFVAVYYGGCDADKKINTIKVIREVSGLGLAAVKYTVEQPPSRILDWVPFERALPACEAVRDAGGGEVRVHRADRSDLPLEVKYTITAYLWDAPRRREDGRAAFVRFLVAALGVDHGRARVLADKGEVTLVEDMDAQHAQARLVELYRLIPSWTRDQRWSISIGTRTTAASRTETT
jgi:hypothetical protein